MIREFSAKPKCSNNKARMLFVMSTSVGFALVLLSTFIPAYKGLVSLAAIILLTLSVMLYTRYIAPVYFYDIMVTEGGEPLFVVRQQTGKRYTTLCRISLYEIVKVEKETAEQRRGHKTLSEVKKYSYLPTLDPAESYRITVNGKYEKAEILIEAGEDFISILSQYANEARTYYTDPDE